MTNDNPYASPAADSADPHPTSGDSESLGTIARATFLAWEKLRLIYVAVLAVVVLLMGLLEGPSQFASFRFWATVAAGAFVANLCFFAAPIIETYVTWLGFHTKWLRIVMFVLGTLFACLLAIATIVLFAVELLPDIA